MKLTFGPAGQVPVRACLVYQDGTPLGGGEPAPQLEAAKQYEAFQGEAGQVCCIRDYESGGAVLFAGVGPREGFNDEKARRAAAKLAEYAGAHRIPFFGMSLGEVEPATLRAVCEALVMACYRYTDFLSSPKKPRLEEVVIEAGEELRPAFQEGLTLGRAVCEARDLVNEPANAQTPEKLAQEAVSLGGIYGFETEVLGEEQILRLGMEAFYAVGNGSPNRPVVIVMRYRGDPDRPQEIVGLVGKGVTYDSGGLNLKSGQRFITMKHDMAGGGTVIGAMCAIAREKLRANVTAVVAACENVISGAAYKPGDIIGSMAGKTIQINSTDAEGRLTLIDAIYYAVEHEKVTRVADIATLTGAARRILGEYGAPVLSNSDGLWQALSRGAAQSGELVCRVPLIEDARQKMRGDVSDYVNTSLAEAGGMVTAALFIEDFTQGRPWIHIDAAGPLWLDREMPYTPKGGSGWGVRALYHMVKDLSAQRS